VAGQYTGSSPASLVSPRFASLAVNILASSTGSKEKHIAVRCTRRAAAAYTLAAKVVTDAESLWEGRVGQ